MPVVRPLPGVLRAVEETGAFVCEGQDIPLLGRVGGDMPKDYKDRMEDLEIREAEALESACGCLREIIKCLDQLNTTLNSGVMKLSDALRDSGGACACGVEGGVDFELDDSDEAVE